MLNSELTFKDNIHSQKTCLRKLVSKSDHLCIPSRHFTFNLLLLHLAFASLFSNLWIIKMSK